MLSLADIKKMPATEIVAVNQRSGNSRGFFEPRVAGGQLGNGAMGNARSTGVPLKAVLDKAGIQQGAKQVVFGGLDGPVMETTPDFAKALDVDQARDGEVMLAYAMNGEPLPMLNGLATTKEPGTRAQYLTALDALMGQEQAFLVRQREIVEFPGRLGIQHRDVLQGLSLSMPVFLPV